MGGDARRLFEFINRVFPGELEEALHDAQSLRTTGLVHGLGPAAAQRADESALIEQMINAAFDDVPLATVQMLGSRREQGVALTQCASREAHWEQALPASWRTQTFCPVYSGGTE